MPLAQGSSAWPTGLFLFGAGFLLRLVDFEGSWNSVLGLILMGVGTLISLVALAAIGPSAVTRSLRAHPVAVAIAIAFVLFTLAAALLAPSN